jgi:hypothetical protein
VGLDPLPSRLGDFKLEDMRIAWYKRAIMPANWKTALDAFVESWHVPGTHPQLLRMDKQGSPATIAESESYSKMYNELFRYHSRHADFNRYGEAGNPSGLRAQFGASPQSIFQNVTYNLRELRALYLKTDLLAAGELMAAADADGPGAGLHYTELRKKHAKAAGMDLPELSDTQLRSAMFDWHMFPNTVFLLDMGCAICYRARPNGLDPDTCIFDVQGLELPTADGIETAKPQYFADWRQGDMGGVLNQDFANMSEVTAGLHSRHFDGHRLNRLQEMTIGNYHRAIDGFLFDGQR